MILVIIAQPCRNPRGGASLLQRKMASSDENLHSNIQTYTWPGYESVAFVPRKRPFLRIWTKLQTENHIQSLGNFRGHSRDYVTK